MKYCDGWMTVEKLGRRREEDREKKIVHEIDVHESDVQACCGDVHVGSSDIHVDYAHDVHAPAGYVHAWHGGELLHEQGSQSQMG